MLFKSATPIWERAGIAPFTFQLQAPRGPDEGSPQGSGRRVGRMQVLDISDGNRGRRTERDGGRYPSSVHVQVSASAAGTRVASSLTVLLQSRSSHTCMVSICLLPLTFAQEAATCLPCQTETRPQSIEKASEAENKKPQTTSYFLLVKQ